jgi:hypothetical protein
MQATLKLAKVGLGQACRLCQILQCPAAIRAQPMNDAACVLVQRMPIHLIPPNQPHRDCYLVYAFVFHGWENRGTAKPKSC